MRYQYFRTFIHWFANLAQLSVVYHLFYLVGVLAPLWSSILFVMTHRLLSIRAFFENHIPLRTINLTENASWITPEAVERFNINVHSQFDLNAYQSFLINLTTILIYSLLHIFLAVISLGLEFGLQYV